MFDAAKIANDLYGIVGLRQSYDPTYAILDADNQVSRSGYFSNNPQNPFVKVSILYDTVDYIDITNEQFNEYVANLQKSSIQEVCNAVFIDPDERERQLVYQYPINKVNSLTLPDGFACLKIYKNKESNVAFNVTRVILDFVGTGDITLQLYSSQQTTPLYEKTITITSENQVETLNWVVNNTGVDYKGEYLLGYITNPDLQPFKRDYEASNYITNFRDIYVDERIFPNHVDPNRIPDLKADKNISEYIGINPDISIYDDYTDLIIQKQNLLAKAIDLQFQINIMNSYSASIRSNLLERYGRDFHSKVNVAINGFKDEHNKIKGAKELLATEITQLRNQIKKLRVGFKGGRILSKTIY